MMGVRLQHPPRPLLGSNKAVLVTRPQLCVSVPSAAGWVGGPGAGGGAPRCHCCP